MVETSALMAILLSEHEAGAFVDAILSAPVRIISAASVLEAHIAAERRSRGSAGEVDHLLDSLSLTVRPVDLVQLQAAREVFGRFGKGRHPAGLNFGDCFSYALAKVAGEPLLYKGADFGLTDIPSALP